MAKKRQTTQSVRQSAKRREEEARKRRNNLLQWVAIVAVIILAAGASFVLLSRLGSDSAEPEEPAEAGETAVPEAQATADQPSELANPDELPEPGPLADLEPAERDGYYQDAPEMIIDPSKDYEAVIRTEKGDLRLRLFADAAPITVNNFVFLAREGFYDGTVFHRVIQDFMAQGGDPSGTGRGGPGYQFVDETDNGLVFDRPGILAMANAGPNTNGSQFFITYVPTPHLDGLHTIFGELVEGEEVLSSLTFVQPGSPVEGDLIEQIAIIER